MFFFGGSLHRFFRPSVRSSVHPRGASELAITAYYPLAKIPSVRLSKRENTIDGSAIFRAIGHEASHRWGQGEEVERGRENELERERKRENVCVRETIEQNRKGGEESSMKEQQRSMLLHAIPSR